MLKGEPAKKDQQGEVKAGGLYVKELTVPKTPMKEDMWMPFKKNKNKEDILCAFDKRIITKRYLYNA